MTLGAWATKSHRGHNSTGPHSAPPKHIVAAPQSHLDKPAHLVAVAAGGGGAAAAAAAAAVAGVEAAVAPWLKAGQTMTPEAASEA